ncbi:MAG: metallopeptidase family protein, partial [Gemmatimonadota bacterium]
MRFVELQQEAARVWDEIPEDYRSGVDGLVIERKAQAHPSLPDIYTLGECLTESYPSDWGGPDTTRSVLVLYYGSFRRLSELDPEFDWEYEIWETVTHELRHHLESLAAEDALEDVDYAMDENFQRLQGDTFDPEFYRYGEPLAPGVFAAERDIFIAIEYAAAEPPGPRVSFDWRGGTASVERP